jgi:serine/threonine-protein kinase
MSRRWVVAGGGALALVGLFVLWPTDPGRTPPPQPVASGATTTTSRPPTTKASPTTTTPRPARTTPEVPGGLVGRDGDDVEDLLKERGYRVEKVSFESGAPKDSVIATVPGAGRPLSEGQTIIVILSKGEIDPKARSFVVPDGLVGSRARVAERLLRPLGVRVTTVQVRSTKEPGTVIATWPTAGSRAEGGRLLLVVASSDD